MARVVHPFHTSHLRFKQKYYKRRLNNNQIEPGTSPEKNKGHGHGRARDSPRQKQCGRGRERGESLPPHCSPLPPSTTRQCPVKLYLPWPAHWDQVTKNQKKTPLPRHAGRKKNKKEEEEEEEEVEGERGKESEGGIEHQVSRRSPSSLRRSIRFKPAGMRPLPMGGVVLGLYAGPCFFRTQSEI